jgi:hypothetical protein
MNISKKFKQRRILNFDFLRNCDSSFSTVSNSVLYKSERLFEHFQKASEKYIGENLIEGINLTFAIGR